NIPSYNATMRTTCVATMLEAGHAENALPQTARATVNCRILPTETAEQTRETLVKVAGDSGVAITPIRQPKPSPPAPPTTEVMKPIETITQQMWPGVPVVPVMSTGATDSLYLRKAGVPVYGTSGIFSDIDDGRAHGKDERIGVKEFYEGQEYLYRLVKAFASPQSNQSQHADKETARIGNCFAGEFTQSLPMQFNGQWAIRNEIQRHRPNLMSWALNRRAKLTAPLRGGADQAIFVKRDA